MSHLSDHAARGRRELALTEINLRFNGIRNRLTAERDTRLEAAINDLFSVVRDAAPDLDAGGRTRANAVDTICGQLLVAHRRMQRIQQECENAWDDARTERARERAPFQFDITADPGVAA